MSRVPLRAFCSTPSRLLPRAAASILLAGALVAPKFAQANDDVIRITVLPFTPIHDSLPQSAGTRTAEFIEKELKEYLDFDVRSVPAPRTRAVAKPGEAEAPAAARAVKAAMAQFERADNLAESRRVKLASDAYSRGIGQYLAGFQEATNFEPLFDAYLNLAVARFRLGLEKQAASAVQDYARLAPGRTPDNLPEVVAKLHEKAVDELHEKGLGGIRITSIPSGATVYLNGSEIGTTPLIARDVFAGEHYLKVSQDGLGTVAQKIQVLPGENAELIARLVVEETGPAANLAKAIGSNELNDEAIAAAASLGKQANAQIVLFGGVHKAAGDEIAVRSYFLQLSDSRLVGLKQITFDSGMFGAPMQVLNLVNDLNDNLDELPESLPLPLPVAGSLPGKRPEEAPSEVRIVPAPGFGQGGVARAGGRAPVRGGDRRVVTTARTQPEAQPEAPTKVAEAAPAPRVRQRGRIGEAPEEPAFELPTAAEEEPDLRAPQPERRAGSVTSLTPEQLRALEIDENKKGSSTGKILLWTGVGVVGAAAIGGLVYFLATPAEATSGTAVVTWR